MTKQYPLRLVVIGQATNEHRRAHLVRLRETLLLDLKEVASGPIHLLIEIAIQRLVVELREAKELQSIYASEMDPQPIDEQMLERHRAKMKAKAGK